MQKYLLPLFVTFYLFLPGATEALNTKARAAIDFGSGAVKIQLAIVDVDANRIIGEPLFAKLVPLYITEDVASNHNKISHEMIKKALNVLSELKEEAKTIALQQGYDSLNFAAIATAIFRTAENGSEVLRTFEKHLGFNFRTLSQQEEGKYGYLTAKALFSEVDETSLIALDSGNSSFQIIAKEDDCFKVYKGPLGMGTVTVILSKEMRHGHVLEIDESGQPISKLEGAELTQLIKSRLPSIPLWLESKLSAPKIAVGAYGDRESLFAFVAKAAAYLNGSKREIHEAIIKRSDAQLVVDAFIDQTDVELKQTGLHIKTLLSGIHLLALMDYFNLEEIHYKWACGNTLGMIISEDLW